MYDSELENHRNRVIMYEIYLTDPYYIYTQFQIGSELWMVYLWI